MPPQLGAWLIFAGSFLLCLTLLLLIVGSAVAKDYDAGEILKRIYHLSEFPDTTQTPRTYFLKGTVARSGLVGEFTTSYDRNKGYVNRLDLGLFKLSQGLAGFEGWESNANEIVNDLSRLDEELLILARIIESREYLSVSQDVLKRECLGAQEYDGRGVFRFRFSPSREFAADVFIDSLNGQVLALQLQYDFIDAKVVFSDFRDVSGMTFAFRNELTANLAELNSTTQTISCGVNVAFPYSTFAKPQTNDANVSFPPDTDRVTTPLEYYQGNLYFRMSVNGSEPRLFLLDSGSNGFVIDATFAEALGMNQVGSRPGMGVAGSAEFSFAIIEEMNLEGIVLRNQLTSVLSFGPELRNALRGVVGVMGYDFLARFIVTVDYERQQMTIFPPSTAVTSKSDDSSAIVPLDFYFNLPTVKAKVNDSLGVFLIDVGSGYGPLLHEYFVKANSFENLPERKAVDDMGYLGGVGGSLPTKAVTIADFELGTLQVQNQPSWMILGGVGISASKRIAGNIGNGFLDQFRVTFDYPHRRLILHQRILD